MTVDLGAAVHDFDAAVSSSRHLAAMGVVEGLVAGGMDPITVMVDVVSVVQRRVGERWERGEWSVAEEHAATSTAAAALESLARAVPAPDSPPRGLAVVACAEHEWHAVPASIVASGLRMAGWEVTMLGASTPNARLTRYLQDLGPDLTAVSSSTAASLAPARSFIESSTAAGIPVLAGGPAFGRDGTRAAALGATAWAPDVRAAVEAAGTLPVVVPAVERLPDEVMREQSALTEARTSRRDAVLRRWSEVTPAMSEGTDEAEEARFIAPAVVENAFHALVGAVLTGDGGIVAESASWTGTVLTTRGFPPTAVPMLGRAVAAELDGLPLAVATWRQHWPAVVA